MSHAQGEVWSLEGKLLAYFEYDGTSDVCCTRLHNTQAEMSAVWRKANMQNCTCGSAGQSVILYNIYAGGYYWPGKVCWNCMCIIEGISSPDDEVEGHPFPPVP